MNDHAYDFFQSAVRRVEIPGQRDLPRNINDIVIDIRDQQFEDSFGLTGAFLVRCFIYPPTEAALTHIKPRGSQNRLLAFIAVPEVTNDLRDAVISRLVQSDTDTETAIIPLDDSFFQKSKEPLHDLHDRLTQYLGQRNLYTITHPVSGRKFFGRETLIRELTDEVHNGQFLGIYGLRKIGKTSLIHQLTYEQLRDDAVAYVDLQQMSNYLESIGNCNPLYWALERDLYTRLEKRDKEKANLLRLGKKDKFTGLTKDKRDEARVIFAEDMESLLDALANGNNAGIKHLVILIDELEEILPLAGRPGVDGYVGFFRLLRGLAQNPRYHGLLSSVVVAANATISETNSWNGYENPVFAFYKSYFLPPLPQNECTQMICDLGKGMSVYWDEDAINVVFAETGGHPFITRLFCSHIVKHCKERPLQVEAQMVKDQIIPFIRAEGDSIMSQISELIHKNFPEELKFLEQIALENLPSEMPNDETLRHLIGYHLIEEKDGGYRLTLNLLRHWLRRRAGIRE